MKTLKELKEFYNLKVGELHTAATAIEDAGDDADVKALDEAFSLARTAAADAKVAVERAESIAEAKAFSLLAVASDEGDVTTVTGITTKVGKEPLTYERHNGRSVFADLYRRDFKHDSDAATRLSRHEAEMRVEQPEKFDLSSTDSAGGYLVAPLYLQEEFIELARAGRVAANVIGSRPLPPGTDSINIPRISTGTDTAVQADGGAVTETDAVLDTIAADVKTIAGMQDVSQQLVDRSVPGIDEVIFADLTADYAQTLDVAVINSSTANNLGLLQVAGINAVTYTDASPTAAELYPKAADAVQQIHTGVFRSPTAWLMHPRRWAFLLASVDSQNRPLVTPYAAVNAIAVQKGVAAEGLVGELQGVPVYVDANIPINLGVGTNEDRIISVNSPSCYLWEDQAGPYLETFRDVGSGTLTVRFRLHNYYAQCNARRPKSISAISGTGLVTPTF